MSENELLSIFRDEVKEYLENLNAALLDVEMKDLSDPTFKPTIVEMNRWAHSMKGAARAVGISMIETLSHYMEEVFNAMLDERLALAPEVADTLYDSLDLIENIMNEQEINEDVASEVLARLEQMVVSQADGGSTNGTADPRARTDSQQVVAVPSVKLNTVDDEPAVADSDLREGAEHSPRAARRSHDTNTQPTIIAQQPTNKRDPHVTQTVSIPPPDPQTIAIRPVEETVRVTVSKLDRLMAEATELIVAKMRGEERQRDVQSLRLTLVKWQREWRAVRSAYIRLVRRVQDQEYDAGELPVLFKFLETNQRYLLDTNRRLSTLAQAVAQDNLHLTTLSDQLQDEIDAMRLIPFDALVGSYQRVVRDLARDTGKQVHIDIVGAYVEIDKTVLDALRDPLMHLVRNAVDHGIEPPAEREAAGKFSIGRVLLSVEQRGGEIVLVVADDGAGIDPVRVRRSVVKRGILSQSEADALSDDEARFFIFHPGLSTSDTVTTISGRGLGMDIVRERVESLRGRVSINSELGAGTRVTINVPVSLTRIRCILLRLGEEQFAIPSVVVERMDTRYREDVFTAEGRDMIVINGQPTPLVSLGAVLNMPSAADPTSEQLHMLLLHSANRAMAFEVDGLLNELELVLKPLGPELARTRFVSGAALLGTGDVVIVLDSNDLVRAAAGAELPRRKMTTITAPVVTQRRMRVLVADDSITTRTLEKNILETAGFEVRVAIDGIEAWSMLAEDDYDVVISDVEMPNMNGLELTQQIKHSDAYRHIPVILLTSLGKPEQREAGLRAGADAYLVKSQFDQGELLATIQAVI